MADEVDATAVVEENLLARQLKIIRSQGCELHPMGECHNCYEPFPPGSAKLFCDQYCSTDWERLKR